MASIRANRKKGKIISYRFTACVERDAAGRQVRKYLTWTPPDGLTPAKAKKMAEREAEKWEEEIRAEYQEEKASGQMYSLPPEKRHDDFCGFINEIWLPLQIRNGNYKPTTITFYENMVKPINSYFHGAVLQEINPIQILSHVSIARTLSPKMGHPRKKIKLLGDCEIQEGSIHTKTKKRREKTDSRTGHKNKAV